MKRLLGFWILVLGVCGASAAGLQVAELKRETPVDFEKEILPVFRNSCLACHNTTKANRRYRQSFATPLRLG